MMIKRITLVSFAILIMLPQVLAKEVTADKARLVAHNFYFKRNNQSMRLDYTDKFIDNVFPINIKAKNVIYFINFLKGGWVAVSASDAIMPVLAYSFAGSYSQLNPPANFLSWISQYNNHIYYALTEDLQPNSDVNKLWSYYLTDVPHNLLRNNNSRSIEPLLTTTWDQGLYYNEMCPSDPGGPGGHCYAGCVPTTMGQVCNYFRFPQTGTGSYSYQCPPYGELSADFGNSNYNWNEMPVNLTTNSLATAQILYHLGVSCDLVYGPNGSGMYNHKAAYALRTFFKYSPETQYVYRDSTNLNWDSLLISHLDRKIPMYYAGWSIPNVAGHAFVCDGYQDSSYFHFNWGWSGSYDGYFYTGYLTPGGSNFNLAQEVIINCFPDTVNYQYPAYCIGADTLVGIGGTLDDGSGPVYNYDDNLNCSWLISPFDSVNFITLEFIKFNTNEKDTLFIYDGNSAEAQLLGSFSGSSVPSDLVSSGDELFINFITDNDITDEGWLISYSSSIPQYCGNTMITAPFDTISDGSGPANYHNLTMCLWIIQPEAGLDITLNFIEFSTEEGHDFVSIYDGNDKIGQFSGSELPDELTATSGIMTIAFSTNSSITDTGWEAHYTTSPVGSGELEVINEMKVFPNPANKLINIELNETVVFTDVYIYDIYGKIVLKSDDNDCKSIVVNTSGLQRGIYFVKITTKNQTTIKKVIIKQ